MISYKIWQTCIMVLLSAKFIAPSLMSVSQIDGNLVLHKGLVDDWLAKALFTDNTTKDGWSYLEVESNPQFPDVSQAYGAGFVEGSISQQIIYNSWRNTQEGFCIWKGEEYCEKLRIFLERNFAWMKSQIREKSQSCPIWHHVELILAQLKGLSEGYNSLSTKSEQITLEDFILMNLSGDLEDLDNVLDSSKKEQTFEEWVNSKDHFGDGRCSALIKVLSHNSDILASHVTWNTYQSMLRIQKKYILPLRMTPSSKERIPGHINTFSSYPTYLHSGDDFNLLSSGLFTMETTIGNSNPQLWKNVKPEGELQEWIRAIVANRLATDGEQWASIFENYNSGTYNNQWMILDYKLFKPGRPIKPKTLYVLEQLPGLVVYGDQSKILSSQGYWPSYNTPFYPKIFKESGLPALVKKYGDWFSYERTPRAQIFRRDQHEVRDMRSFFKLMRYNDYKHDPLSACKCDPPYSAENAISARNDLNPKNGTYPFGALGHRSHGGIDCKATSSSLFSKFRFLAVAGPTYDQQPVFKWSEQDFIDTPHYGHPDAWKFPVILHKWHW